MEGCLGAGEGFILLISRSARLSRLTFLIARDTEAPISSQHDVLCFTLHVENTGACDLWDASSMRTVGSTPLHAGKWALSAPGSPPSGREGAHRVYPLSQKELLPSGREACAHLWLRPSGGGGASDLRRFSPLQTWALRREALKQCQASPQTLEFNSSGVSTGCGSSFPCDSEVAG